MTRIHPFLHSPLILIKNHQEDCATVASTVQTRSRLSPTATCTSTRQGHLHRFWLAEAFGGKCNLRIDDTTRSKRPPNTWMPSRKTSTVWGFDWEDVSSSLGLFRTAHQFALQMIHKAGLRGRPLGRRDREYRDADRAGKESPNRNRS
jgi:hypothetical protein